MCDSELFSTIVPHPYRKEPKFLAEIRPCDLRLCESGAAVNWKSLLFTNEVDEVLVFNFIKQISLQVSGSIGASRAENLPLTKCILIMKGTVVWTSQARIR